MAQAASPPAVKPRLLFVIHSLQMGGTEKLVLDIAAAVQQQYTVGICCLDSRGALWSKAEQQGYALYECHRQPGWRWSNFASVLRVLREFAPDLIHAHQYTPFFFCSVAKLLSPLTLSSTSCKLILTEHGRFIPDVVSWKRRMINRLLIHTASAITAVSEFSKRALVENEGFSSKPIEVIYNGLRPVLTVPKAQTLAEELSLTPDTRFIGFVGSLRPVKNPLYLLEAFAQIAAEQLDTCLVYIGDGPLRGELEHAIAGHSLSGRVFLLGERNPATPYFCDFAVYVLPSLSEAASLALLEAMANEVPVIVTDRGGSPELVGYGAAGQVVPCGDVIRLAQALRRALGNEAECKEFVVAAKRRVEQEFAFEKMIDKYSELYAGLQ